jgi:hypothetical protein
MAAGGFREFVAGEVLDEDEINDYLMQGVLVFAGTAARGSAITSPVEGQFAFLKDSDQLTYHDGSQWVEFKSGGAAVVSGTTGSPTIVSGTAIGGKTYNTYTFNGAGSMIFSDEGYVDVAVIGGGGGSNSTVFALSAGGGGGGVLFGSTFVSAGTVTVSVGAGGAGNTAEDIRAGKGGVSSFGSVMQINGGAGGYSSNSSGWILNGAAGAGGGEGGVYRHSSAPKPRGSGAGSTVFATNVFDGRVINITGANVTYGAAKATNAGAGGANTGDGAGALSTGAAGQAGGSGRVIVRVEV